MSIRPLARYAVRLGLLALGGVAGAVAVVWIRANSDWVTVRLPGVMAPGSAVDVEYEARVYGIVAISFAVGLLSAIWLALAIWLRAVRRERRLARALERFERGVEARRGGRSVGGVAEGPALPPASGASPEHDPVFADFDELDDDALLSEAPELPEGYDLPPEADDEPEGCGGAVRG